MKRFRVSAVFVTALLVSVLAPLAQARAESKSYAAVKGLLPDKTAVLVGANISTIQKTTIYQSLVPALINKEPDAKEGLEMVKTACGIDVVTSVVDVTVALTEDETAVIAVALSGGIDEKKVVECLNKMAEKEKKGKLVSKTTGKITEYTMQGEKDKLYIAWLAKDVLAIASEPTDKAMLEKMIAGKGAKGDVSKAIGKINTDAAFWVAAAKKTPMQKAGTMKMGYGTVDVKSGVIAVDGHIIMSSAAEAKKLVDDAKKDMDKSKAQMPPDLAKIMTSLKFTANGDDANFTLSLTEKELMQIVGLMMTQM
jgi:hypothetical protein